MPVHESLFSRKNVFQLCDGSGSSVFLLAETAKDSIKWIKLLSATVSCCDYCSVAKSFSLSLENASEIQKSSSMSASNNALNCISSEKYRVYRKIRLQVQEAKDLVLDDGLRRGQLYCQVEVNGLKVAKTQLVMNSSTPFWGEEFLLDDVPLCTNRARVHVFWKRNLTKDLYCGTVSLELPLEDERTKIDGWFNMCMVDQYPEVASAGSLRITASITVSYFLIIRMTRSSLSKAMMSL